MNVAQREIPRWLLPFTRVTSGTALLSEVDGLRFLAIASVLLFHMDQPMFDFCAQWLKGDIFSKALHYVLSRGHFGVPLFFGISGFILMLPFARAAAGVGKEVNLTAYYWRRLTRLEPPYFICTSVLFVLTSIHFHKSLSEYVPHFAASLAYLHNVIYGRPSIINEVAWSLEIEVQFYCLAPLIAKVFKLPVFFRRAAIILMSIACCVMSLTEVASVRTVLIYGQFFLAGMLYVDLYMSRLTTEKNGHSVYDWVFLAGLLMPILCEDLLPKWLWTLLKPVAVFALLIGALQSTFVRRIFQAPLVFIIGGMCYTIYLWHSILWSVLWHRTDKLGSGLPYWGYFLLQSLWIVPFVVGVSSLLFVWLERPFMVRDWPKTLVARMRSIAGLGNADSGR